MSKKRFKKTIQEAVNSAIRGDIISEGPISFAKSVGSGIKGSVQTMGGNYRVNRARSYMNQFGQKAQKTAEKFSRKTLDQASKMKASTNPAVKQTGQRIEDEVADTQARVKDLVQDIDASFPSAVGGDTGSSMAGGTKRGGPFYSWLQQTHGISAQDFHTPQRQGGMGKSAQDDLIKQYISQTGQKPQVQGDMTQGKASKGKKGKFEKWYAKNYGDIPFKDLGADGKAKAIAQFNSQKQFKDFKKSQLKKAQGTPQQAAPAPRPVPQPQTPQQAQPAQVPQQPQIGQQAPAQPQMPSQPSLKATIGDMVGRKAIAPQEPSVMYQPGPEMKTQAGKAQAGKSQPAPQTGRPSQMKTREDPFSKPIPAQPQYGLTDIGAASQEEIEKFTDALNRKDKLATSAYKDLKYGNVDLAKKQFAALKARDFKPAGDSTKQFKNIVNQAAGQAAGDGTEPFELQKVKPGTAPFELQQAKPKTPKQSYMPPSPAQVQPQTQPYPTTTAADVDTSTKAIRRPTGKKKKKKTEAEEPLMTMADFMKRSKGDPDQEKFARQKIDQERQSSSKKGKKRKKGRVLIQDTDEGARIEDKFVSSDERKDEGY